MVKGRPGLYLEAWKFGVYVSIPVIASVYFSEPETIKKQADYWRFIEYPKNPNTNVRQKIQELAKEKEDQRSQRMAYQRQLEELQSAAERSSSVNYDDDDSAGIPEKRRSWWRRWFSGNSEKTHDSSQTTTWERCAKLCIIHFIYFLMKCRDTEERSTAGNVKNTQLVHTSSKFFHFESRGKNKDCGERLEERTWNMNHGLASF